jgi:chromosome segregation ATPase
MKTMLTEEQIATLKDAIASGDHRDDQCANFYAGWLQTALAELEAMRDEIERLRASCIRRASDEQIATLRMIEADKATDDMRKLRDFAVEAEVAALARAQKAEAERREALDAVRTMAETADVIRGRCEKAEAEVQQLREEMLAAQEYDLKRVYQIREQEERAEKAEASATMLAEQVARQSRTIDEMGDRNRRLVELATIGHEKNAGDYVCPAFSGQACTCGAAQHNARVAAIVEGK